MCRRDFVQILWYLMVKAMHASVPVDEKWFFCRQGIQMLGKNQKPLEEPFELKPWIYSSQCWWSFYCLNYILAQFFVLLPIVGGRFS